MQNYRLLRVLLSTILLMASNAAFGVEVEVTLSGPMRTDLSLDERLNGYFEYGDWLVLTVRYETEDVTDSNPSESRGVYYDSIRDARLIVYSSTGDIK